MTETESEKNLPLQDAIDRATIPQAHVSPTSDADQTSNASRASLEEKSFSTLIESFEELYTGPIPHPETIKAYDLLVPGIAEIIIKESFEESKHRRNIEFIALEADIRSRTQGMFLGAILSALCIVGGCTVAILASPTAGAAIITGNVVALASCFYLGLTRGRRKDESTSDLPAQKTEAKSDGR